MTACAQTHLFNSWAAFSKEPFLALSQEASGLASGARRKQQWCWCYLEGSLVTDPTKGPEGAGKGSNNMTWQKETPSLLSHCVLCKPWELSGCQVAAPFKLSTVQASLGLLELPGWTYKAALFNCPPQEHCWALAAPACLWVSNFSGSSCLSSFDNKTGEQLNMLRQISPQSLTFFTLDNFLLMP